MDYIICCYFVRNKTLRIRTPYGVAKIDVNIPSVICVAPYLSSRASTIKYSDRNGDANVILIPIISMAFFIEAGCFRVVFIYMVCYATVFARMTAITKGTINIEITAYGL
ncbi:hypothetical protein HS5_11240 [Acidianus sp. HS-5]|nr:hypothetical protein HS5_11240 [Acidianus sp. HS-5]